MEEIWKVIEGYPSYEVSNTGSIKSISLKNKRERILKPCLNKNSNLYVVSIIDEDRNITTRAIAKIVAEAFMEVVQKKNNKTMQLAYKDGDRSNCSIDNLFFCETKRSYKLNVINEEDYKCFVNIASNSKITENDLSSYFGVGLMEVRRVKKILNKKICTRKTKMGK